MCEVDSTSALAWIGFARDMLDAVVGDPGISIPAETLAVVQGYLHDWEEQANLGPTMSLQADMPADELEHLGHVFMKVSRYAVDKADERGFDVSPPEADGFFAALSEAVIDALEYSGEGSATEFASGLRNDWPRTDRLLPDGTFLPVSDRFGSEDESGGLRRHVDE